MIGLRELAELAERYAEHLDHEVASLPIGGRSIDTDAEPMLMAVVNLSRDSAYRSSVATSTDHAVRRARILHAQGAHCIDVGAESVDATKQRVDRDRQIETLVPVIEGIAAEGIAVSIESYDSPTVRAGLEAGARIINLTGSGDDAETFDLAAEYDATVVLCHVYGTHARALDENEVEADPIPAMLEQFAERIDEARSRGVRGLAIDPGLGFGFRRLPDPVDRIQHQATTLMQSFRLRELGLPLCQALPHALDLFEEEFPSAEGFFTVLAGFGGTGIYRTHEVSHTAAVLRAVRALSPL